MSTALNQQQLQRVFSLGFRWIYSKTKIYFEISPVSYLFNVDEGEVKVKARMTMWQRIKLRVSRNLDAVNKSVTNK